MVKIATAAEAMPGSIKLCYGESDMPTPAFICEAAHDAARGGHTFYTHTAGYTELRDAIAAKVHAAAWRDVSRVGNHEHRRRLDGDLRRHPRLRRLAATTPSSSLLPMRSSPTA